ncbi:hypothetical protein ACH40E_13350 [Streptomyces acidicola]
MIGVRVRTGVDLAPDDSTLGRHVMAVPIGIGQRHEECTAAGLAEP